jgi:phosphoribosylformimino-5-aminoimidazole carboxamide ribotide isomerase
MQIYPALDLRNNRCVRLHQGKFDQETCYSDDPLAIINGFIDEGANWLHIVDLDAAKNPAQNQFHFIKELVNNFSIKVQVGGGIRSSEQIKKYLDNGVTRIIIGSQAVKDPIAVKQWFREFGAQHLVLALDVEWANNRAYVAVHGWQQKSDAELIDVITSYAEVNLTHVLCTDISRDGTLTGPNLHLYEDILQRFATLQLQASGGISNLLDLQKLRELPVAGAIIGKALYEKKFKLSEVLAC